MLYRSYNRWNTFHSLFLSAVDRVVNDLVLCFLCLGVRLHDIGQYTNFFKLA